MNNAIIVFYFKKKQVYRWGHIPNNRFALVARNRHNRLSGGRSQDRVLSSRICGITSYIIHRYKSLSSNCVIFFDINSTTDDTFLITYPKFHVRLINVKTYHSRIFTSSCLRRTNKGNPKASHIRTFLCQHSPSFQQAFPNFRRSSVTLFTSPLRLGCFHW